MFAPDLVADLIEQLGGVVLTGVFAVPITRPLYVLCKNKQKVERKHAAGYTPISTRIYTGIGVYFTLEVTIMSGIVSGLIGGAVSVALTAYIATRVGKSATPGQLRFGKFMWILGIACLAFALLPVALTLFAHHDREFWAKVGLFIGFGVGAVYCFGEAAFVRGIYDEDGIVFSTPWTGQKREKWEDLVTVELNDWCSWYTLTFRNGNKVRLSRYLGGHLSALEMADAQCELCEL